jgi:mycothiol system anti-sigma-R factor
VSCGKPHETPCADVLDRVYEFIDGELDSDRRREIKTHLDECAPCLQEFGLEEQVKAIVKRSCSDPAPPELRAKVLSHIAAARAELRADT